MISIMLITISCDKKCESKLWTYQDVCWAAILFTQPSQQCNDFLFSIEVEDTHNSQLTTAAFLPKTNVKDVALLSSETTERS